MPSPSSRPLSGAPPSDQLKLSGSASDNSSTTSLRQNVPITSRLQDMLRLEWILLYVMREEYFVLQPETALPRNFTTVSDRNDRSPWMAVLSFGLEPAARVIPRA